MEINKPSTVIQKHSSDDRIYSHNVSKSPSDKYHDYIPTGVIDLLPDTEIKIRNESEFPILENDEEIDKIDKIIENQVVENQYLLFNEDNNDDYVIYTPYTIELLEEEMMILQPNYIFELMLYKNINMIEENELFYNYGFSDSDDDDDDNISNYGGEGEEGDLSPDSGNEGISSICFSDTSARSTTSSLNSHTQTKLRRKKPLKRSSNGSNSILLLLDKNKLPPTKPQTPTILQLQQQQINSNSRNSSRNSRNSRTSNHSRNPSLIYMNNTINDNTNSPGSNRQILKRSLNELSTTSVFSLASTDNITHEVEDGYINQSILNSRSLGIHISIQLSDNTKMSNKIDVTQYNENSKKIVEITRDLLLNKKKSINDQLQNISKTNYVKNNNTTTTTLNHSIPIIISIENVIDKSIIPPIYYPQFINFGITGYLGWYYTRHNLSLLQNNINTSSLIIKFLPQQTLITGLRIERNSITTISPSHSLKYNTYHIVDCIKDYYNKNLLNNNNNNNLNILASPLSPLSPLNNIATTPSTVSSSLSPSPSPTTILPSANIMNWSVGKCIDEWKKCTDANNFYFNCPKGSDSRNGNFVMSKITLHHSILYEIHKSLMNEIHDYCKENNIIKPKYIILLDHQEYHIPSEFIFLDFADSEVHVSSNSRWCGVGSGIISCNKFLQSYKIQSYM